MKQLGVDYLVIEKGTLVDAIFRYPTNMVFFTTPELLEIGGVPFTTPYEKPTRIEALRYYRKVVDAYQLQVTLEEEVLAVERELNDVAADAASARFLLETRTPRGGRRVRRAGIVVLAMGYYGEPNLLRVPGEALAHVSHYYDEAHPYYRKRVVIVGGKNSACEAALELHRAGAHVTLIHRQAELGDSVKYWVKPDIENRIKEGSIAAHFNTRVVEIRPTDVIVERIGEAPTPLLGTPPPAQRLIPAEGVLLLTGYHADAEFMRRAGIEIDPESWAPRYHPNTFETNVPNLFVAGGQLAGKRTGTVFIENGRLHGERIARVIADRLGAGRALGV